MKNRSFYILWFVQLMIGAGSIYSQSNVAIVGHAPTIRGLVEGGMQQMRAEPLVLGGSASISGDCFLPGSPTFKLNGSPMLGQVIAGQGSVGSTNYTVTLSGNAQIGRIFTRTDPSSLPAVGLPTSVIGMRSITLDKRTEFAGDFSTVRNLTLNGKLGQIAIPPGSYGSFAANGASGFTLGIEGGTQPAFYSFQRLLLNGQAQVQIVGPVIVTLGDSLVLKTVMGSSTMPSWLTLWFSSGDLTLEGNAILHGYVINPSGSVMLNGSSQLRGGLVADWLTIDGGARLSLIDPPVISQPPSIALTAPEDHAIFAAPATITLAALAEDADGSIAKVEFYQGTISPVKLGEATGTPFEFTWADVPPGTYALTAKAYDNDGGVTISAVRTVMVQRMVPYFTGFERIEGYAPGALAGLEGWTASIGVTITNSLSYRGAQSILLPPRTPTAEAAHLFGSYAGQSLVFVDLLAKPAAGDGVSSSVFVQADVALVALVRAETQGELYIWDGGGGWRSAGAKVLLAPNGQAANWIRVTLREDFATKKWDLYLDGKLIAYDAGFTDGAKTGFERLKLLGSTAAVTAFDDFYVGFENPLFADVNQDGIDDAWETLYGLGLTTNNRDRVLAGSTMPVIQAYFQGVDPRGAGGNDPKPDTDLNGLPDGWEINYFGHIGVDPDADPNGNGLTNLQDYQLGLNPLKAPSPNAVALVNLRLFSP